MRRILILALLLSALVIPGQSDAARQTNGTNQTVISASALNYGSANILSISFWLYWDAFANDDDIAVETQSVATGGASDSTFTVDPNAAAGSFLVGVIGGAGGSFVTFTRPSAAAWHHYLVNIDVNSAIDIPTVYLDAASQVLTHTGANNGVGSLIFSNTRKLNLMSRDNASLFGAGRIADVAVWTGVNLSGADATSLNGGASPTSISPGNLLYYWKLCGDASPEPPTTGSIDMTVTGATQVANPTAIAAACAVAITPSLGWMEVDE